MKKIMCPYCKNTKDFIDVNVEEKDICAHLCTVCGRIWIDDTKDKPFEYNKDEFKNRASLNNDKE